MKSQIAENSTRSIYLIVQNKLQEGKCATLSHKLQSTEIR